MTTQLAGARRLCVRHAILGVFAAFAAGSAQGSQILEEHSATLTKYVAAATPVQGAIPNYLQRGVFLDGTLRAPAPFGWALAGNPFGEAWNGSARLGSVSLVTGTYEVTETDLALPAPGMGGWVVGRTYNAQQWVATDQGGGVWAKTHSDSNGYQGRNWFQSSQPEIKIAEGATDDLDVLYLVYGADRYVEFKRQGTSGTAFNTFKGVNGAAGAVLYTPVATTGEPDTFTLYDQVGNRAVFFGFDADAGAAAGQLWKTVDTAANTAFIGDSVTGSTAISSGFDGSGRILYAYDAADRRYSYTYTTLDSVARLTQVKAETKSGGTWASPSGVTEVGKVEYSYYQTGATTYGDAGNLRTVKITTPLSPSGISSVAQKYYRYWTGTYNASTNPGHQYSLQYVLNFEGARAYDWTDSTLNDSFLTATESSLKPFAESYFEYDSSQRIRSFWGNGQCGCSGTGNGTHALSYPLEGALGSTSGYSADITFKTEVDVDNDDVSIVSSNFGKSVGWGKLTVGPNDTLTGFVGGFRKGYCGYEHDGTNPKIMHVRHRAYLADLGRWTRRDPLGYVDGANLYGYVGGEPYGIVDPLGLCGRGRPCGIVPTQPSPRDPFGGVSGGVGTDVPGPPPPPPPPIAGGGGGGGGSCPPAAVCSNPETSCKRIVVGFEGFGGVIGVSTPFLRNDWLSERCEQFGASHTDGQLNSCYYFAHDEVDRAVNTVRAAALTRCGQNQYPSIVVLGFSNGGHGALRFARRLKDQIGRPVDVGITADPIPTAPQADFYNYNDSHDTLTAGEATRWANWYQQNHTTTTILNGRPLPGATPNTLLTDPGIDHLNITHTVKNQVISILDLTPLAAPGTP